MRVSELLNYGTLLIEQSNTLIYLLEKIFWLHLQFYCRLMAVSQWVGIATGLSVVCLSSVTFVYCGQTAIGRLMISSLSDRANIWLRQALNSIEIGLAVFEQWRLQWGYPPFRVDRDRLIGHIFGSIARRKHRTAKIMAPYYRQLFAANPMVLTPLSADDL